MHRRHRKEILPKTDQASADPCALCAFCGKNVAAIPNSLTVFSLNTFARLATKHLSEERRRAAFFIFGDFFGSSRGDDLSSAVTGFGSDVDDVVGLRHQIEMMLDDDDRVSFVDETVQHTLE